MNRCTMSTGLLHLSCNLLMVTFFLGTRKLRGHQALHDGAHRHYPEGLAVPVLEDEGSRSCCHGHCCQGTNRVTGSTTPWYGADGFNARTGWTHMGWQGKNCETRILCHTVITIDQKEILLLTGDHFVKKNRSCFGCWNIHFIFLM